MYCLTKYQPTLYKNEIKRFVIRFRVSFPYLLRKDSQKTRRIPLQTDLPVSFETGKLVDLI